MCGHHCGQEDGISVKDLVLLKFPHEDICIISYVTDDFWVA